MTTKPRFGFALTYVSDIEAAKRFYTDVLGLDVERENPVFVQFKDATGSHFAIAGDEPLGDGDDPELYWVVDDAEAAFGDLSDKAPVTLPLKEMPFGKVFAIDDPDGRPRYLVEFAQDRPSRPVE